MSRKSKRLEEKRMKLLFSLPEFEEDSSNEASDGAASELDDLEETENINGTTSDEHNNPEIDDADMADYASSDESQLEDEGDWEDSSDEDTEGWSHNTEEMDEIATNFEDKGIVVGNIGENPIDFFESIWNNKISNEIVDQTNLYATQNESKNWQCITVVELNAFIGCLILMGIHQLPSLKCYWSSDPALRVNAVADVMTEVRFKKIAQNLHCNNNEFILPKFHPQHVNCISCVHY